MKTGHVLLILGAFILNSSFIVAIYQRNYNLKLEEEIRGALAEIGRLTAESNRNSARNRTALRELQAEFERFAERQQQFESRLGEVGSTLAGAQTSLAPQGLPPGTDDGQTPAVEPPPAPVLSGNYLRIVGNDGKVYFQRIDR